MLLRCRSLVGTMPADDMQLLGRLRSFQQDHPEAKLCASPDDTGRNMSVRIGGEMAFSPETTQYEELFSLVTTVATLADHAEEQVFGVDKNVDGDEVDSELEEG
ncbi:MAG: hypothetical protein NTX87_02605 [Planctomycetota bacterium]|nr:hypothetical protein [Planctomycetota bacterium]